MTVQPSSSFDISPMFKLYKETIELWKKDYDILKSALLPADDVDGKRGEAESITSAYDAALLDWQKSGDELFKRFVQNQIELCDFFGNCWEQYLKLPEQLSQCRSLTDLGNLRSSFLSQFANDYMQETEKLAKPVADLARQVAPPVLPHRLPPKDEGTRNMA